MLYTFGNFYLDEQRYPDAIHLYEEVIRLNPSYAGAYNTLAIAYMNLSQPIKAERYWKKALALNPQDKTIYLNLIELYRQQGNQQNADYYRQQLQSLHKKSGR
jgi:tetratricopeptide (TPR) repeat protein